MKSFILINPEDSKGNPMLLPVNNIESARPASNGTVQIKAMVQGIPYVLHCTNTFQSIVDALKATDIVVAPKESNGTGVPNDPLYTSIKIPDNMDEARKILKPYLDAMDTEELKDLPEGLYQSALENSFGNPFNVLHSKIPNEDSVVRVFSNRFKHQWDLVLKAKLTPVDPKVRYTCPNESQGKKTPIDHALLPLKVSESLSANLEAVIPQLKASKVVYVAPVEETAPVGNDLKPKRIRPKVKGTHLVKTGAIYDIVGCASNGNSEVTLIARIRYSLNEVQFILHGDGSLSVLNSSLHPEPVKLMKVTLDKLKLRVPALPKLVGGDLPISANGFSSTPVRLRYDYRNGGAWAIVADSLNKTIKYRMSNGKWSLYEGKHTSTADFEGDEFNTALRSWNLPEKLEPSKTTELFEEKPETPQEAPSMEPVTGEQSS